MRSSTSRISSASGRPSRRQLDGRGQVPLLLGHPAPPRGAAVAIDAVHMADHVDRTELPPELQRPLPEVTGFVEVAALLPDLDQTLQRDHLRDAVAVLPRQLVASVRSAMAGVLVADRAPCVADVPHAEGLAPMTLGTARRSRARLRRANDGGLRIAVEDVALTPQAQQHPEDERRLVAAQALTASIPASMSLAPACQSSVSWATRNASQNRLARLQLGGGIRRRRARPLEPADAFAQLALRPPKDVEARRQRKRRTRIDREEPLESDAECCPRCDGARRGVAAPDR